MAANVELLGRQNETLSVEPLQKAKAKEVTKVAGSYIVKLSAAANAAVFMLTVDNETSIVDIVQRPNLVEVSYKMLDTEQIRIDCLPGQEKFFSIGANVLGCVQNLPVEDPQFFEINRNN